MNRRTFNQLASLSALGALTATTNVVAQSNASPVKRPRFSEPDPIDFNNHAGFTSIFDGKTLSQWDGNPDVWKVEDGAIVGISTRESPSGNTFIVYHGAHAKDFDLKLEIKVENGGGSGVQYRSHTGYPPPGGTGGRGRPGEPLAPPPRAEWTMIGPQADFWYPEKCCSHQLHRPVLFSEHGTRYSRLAWPSGPYATGQGTCACSRHWRPDGIRSLCANRRLEPVQHHGSWRSLHAYFERTATCRID